MWLGMGHAVGFLEHFLGVRAEPDGYQARRLGVSVGECALGVRRGALQEQICCHLVLQMAVVCVGDGCSCLNGNNLH